MSKRNPSRSERFSAIQSALGNALSIIEDFVTMLSDAIKDCEQRQNVDEREEFKNPFDMSERAKLDEVAETCESAKNDAEELKDELQNWLDNMPENLQQSMKADELQEAIDALDEFTQALEEIDADSVIALFDGSDSFEPDEMLEALEDMQQNIETAQAADVMFPGMF